MNQTVQFALRHKGLSGQKELTADADIEILDFDSEKPCVYCEKPDAADQGITVLGLRDENGIDIDKNTRIFQAAERALKKKFDVSVCQKCSSTGYPTVVCEEVLEG